MDLKKISEALSVSEQIHPDDVATLARRGFGAIICNRPDGEAADQPTHEEMEQAAQVMMSKDAREGPRAFKEKRQPAFRGE